MNCKKCGKTVAVHDDISRNSQLCPKCVESEELLMEKLEQDYRESREQDDIETNPQYYEEED